MSRCSRSHGGRARRRSTRLLPPPLEPTSDVVLAHVYRMNDVDWLGAYGESNLSVGCSLPGTEFAGSYSPYLFLSSDVGVAHGREVHGQPKKFGEPILEIRGDLTVGVVRRNGIDVLTGTMPTRQRPDSLDSLTRHFDFALNINLKAVDEIDGRPAIRQLTARRLADVRVHECWGGPCTVELRPNAQAPVHRLPVRRDARRPLLARRLHARPGPHYSRLSRWEALTPLPLHLFTPDAQYADDGVIERETAGPDVDWTICRERNGRTPSPRRSRPGGRPRGLARDADRRRFHSSHSKVPGDRSRRRRLRSDRPRGGGPRRHPRVQYAGLWHERSRRPRDRADARADPRHCLLS